MSATAISRKARGPLLGRSARTLRKGARTVALWLVGALVALTSAAAWADYTNRAAEAGAAVPVIELLRVTRAFDQAKARLTSEPTNAEAAWQFGRACFELADIATNSAQRAEIANRGIATCRQLVAREPKLAAAHYYLGLNLGELARTETFRALKLVKEMETEFRRAIELDARLNYAGPHRALGMLYQDAPGWPISLGSRKRAREHLLKAAELAPNFPENRLCLIEALIEWGDRKPAEAQLKDAMPAIQTARTEFAGEAWAYAWKDWEARLAKVQVILGERSPVLRSPRAQTN